MKPDHELICNGLALRAKSFFSTSAAPLSRAATGNLRILTIVTDSVRMITDYAEFADELIMKKDRLDRVAPGRWH